MHQDVLRRLLLDAAVLTVGALAFVLRQPWLSPDLVPIGPGAAGLLALGIAPFAASFVIVEAVAFAIPAARPWVRGGPVQRERLWRVAVGVGLGMAALQAFAMAVALERMTPDWSGPAFRLLVVVGFVVVNAGVAVASRLVDRYGLGGGFALFLLVGAAIAVWNWVTALARLDVVGGLVPSVVLAGVVGTVAFVLTRPPYPAWGGLVPAMVAVGVGNLVHPLGTVCGIVAAGLTWIVVSAALARWAHPPDRVAAVGAPDPLVFLERRTAVRRRWGSAHGYTLLLCGGVVVPALILPGPLQWVSPMLFSTALLVALVADIGEEAVFRSRSSLRWAPAWPLHQVWLVTPALEALAAAGIPAHVRSVRYRALTGPIGPLVPMDVLVPEDRVTSAREVLEVALRIDVSAVIRSH